jgi:hypothetical protein
VRSSNRLTLYRSTLYVVRRTPFAMYFFRIVVALVACGHLLRINGVLYPRQARPARSIDQASPIHRCSRRGTNCCRVCRNGLLACLRLPAFTCVCPPACVGGSVGVLLAWGGVGMRGDGRGRAWDGLVVGAFWARDVVPAFPNTKMGCSKGQSAGSRSCPIGK